MPHHAAKIQAEMAIHDQQKEVVVSAEKPVRIGWTYADAFKNVQKRMFDVNSCAIGLIYTVRDTGRAMVFCRE